MKLFRKRSKKFWMGVIGCFAFWPIMHALWQPGLVVRDGRDNLNQNALWIGHGWLGADSWFTANHRTNQSSFRSPASLQKLAKLCAQNGISDLYPHLCPNQPDGSVAEWDDAQVERFLDNTPGLRVMPWIGGRLDGSAQIGSKPWRAKFIASVKKLMKQHPRLAGVHVNFEPWKSGNAEGLVMLDEIRAALPAGKLLSISAYPPPTWFYSLAHAWDEAYFRQVAQRCDQMALMAYDSSVQDRKMFEWFVARWTRSSLEWTANSPRKTRILIGIPTYDDAGIGAGLNYHQEHVENVESSLQGVHRGLRHWGVKPSHFQGVAVYSEWVTSEDEWARFRREWTSSGP